MQLITTVLLALGVTSAVAVPPGSPPKYYLKTVLKPKQSGKDQFNNLYLNAYHSGAGFNDAVLLTTRTNAVVGYLNKTNVAPANGHSWYDQKFNISGSYPYDLFIVQGVNTYAAWQPVQINSVEQNSPQGIGFFINSTGLQLSTAPTNPKASDFTGWVVCQWWRGVPQLFWGVISGPVQIPSSCAHVNLVPEYFP